MLSKDVSLNQTLLKYLNIILLSPRPSRYTISCWFNIHGIPTDVWTTNFPVHKQYEQTP